MTTHEISEGPWELIVGNENHGPYVVDRINRDVCDCYAMSSPAVASVQNGGTSKPVPFANAEANARLIAAAPELLAALKNILTVVEKSFEPSQASLDNSGWVEGRALKDAANDCRAVIASLLATVPDRVVEGGL